MDSFISGIIDCVARPSTTDSPVRVIRKSASESPNCVSSHPAVVSADSSHSSSVTGDSDSHSSSYIPPPPNHVRGVSSGSLSCLMVPGESTPIKSVLTAEGIIMGDELGIICDDDDGTINSESIDNAVIRQFEAAFATFLYKNPAFNSMSHRTLQKLRNKLQRESAKNIKVEAKLRQQLADLRHAKRSRELELQRELLVVTRAKASREAELVMHIQKTRQSCMRLDQQIRDNSCVSSQTGTLPTTDAASTASAAASPFASLWSSPSPTATTSPAIAGIGSFEEFQREIQKNQMEQAHVRAEMEKIKMQIAEQSVQGTP